MIDIIVDGKTYTLVRGWNKLTSTLGCHYLKGIGARFYSTKRALVNLKVYNISTAYQFESRGLCTIRPDTVALTQYMFASIGPEDFRVGGAMGINPCGDSRPIHEHDAIMRRCPVGLYDMETGRALGINNVDPTGYDLVRFNQIKGYEPNQGVKPYDGQHLIRAYRIGMLHLDDPFVRQDLQAILLDCKVVWTPRAAQITAGTPNIGHGNVGREWAWVTYLAILMQDVYFIAKMKSIANHIHNLDNGLMQRLKNGAFYGSPHPWTPSPGGSGVDPTVDVAQDIEACMHVMIYCKLGMIPEALKLANTVLSKPKRKWIAWTTGEGVGSHGADSHHPWFALGALAQVAPDVAKAYALKWPVPKPDYMGGSMGPYLTLPEIRAALVKWETPGKSRWFLEATA